MADFNVADITGKAYPAGDPGYKVANDCYSTSSEQEAHDMNPGLIIEPADARDIAIVLKYAKASNPPKPVAIRTGGHQYSGASSTGLNGILLDLNKTFENEATFLPEHGDGKKTHIRTSVSWRLENFNKLLANQFYLYKGTNYGYFVPHGQCFYVNLGGHMQTGGYGQLGRSFGLLGDYVTEIELVDPDLIEAENFTKKVSKEVDPELFYAILGGSPGNLGVVTHFTVQIMSDVDFLDCVGQRTAWFFDMGKFQYLMDQLVELSDEKGKLPQCYDICISVVSKSWKGWTPWPGLGEAIEQHYKKHDISPVHDLNFPIPMIVIFAQYCPVPGSPKFDPSIFERFTKLFHSGDIKLALHNELHRPGDDFKPISALTKVWLMPYKREYPFPYIKRTFLTNWTASKLKDTNWVSSLTTQVEKIIKSPGCYTACQLQYFGGEESAFYKNRNNGTTYSWRDSSYVVTMDCFYNIEDDAGAFEFAKEWQMENDRIMNGGEGSTHGPLFSDQDRRVLWGSFSKADEDWNLDAIKEKYYEPDDDNKKYKHLQAVRARVDPQGIYTPNVFSVKADTGARNAVAT